MTPDLQWHVVRIVELLLPFVGTLLILFGLPRPRSFRWRAIIAILATWVAYVLFTTEVYNPIGIAHAERVGAESPWQGFDNNNTAPIIFCGWLIPAFTVALVQLFRFACRRLGLSSHDDSTPRTGIASS